LVYDAAKEINHMEKPLAWFYRVFKVDSRSRRTSDKFCSRYADDNRLGSYRPMFDYSDTWQLVINTGTTIVTFLMVFLIQRTQNRDTQALHLKLDELIRVTKGARNVMLDLEHMDDEHLKRLRDIYERLGSQARGDDTEKK
jgi:low affinity Fe/Cu permease